MIPWLVPYISGLGCAVDGFLCVFVVTWVGGVLL